MKLGFLARFILFALLSTIIIASAAFALGAFDNSSIQSSLDVSADTTCVRYKTVIIDAGHGGEDGGASSAAGLIEKNVNLEIAQMLRDMLSASGVNVVMTREDDRLLYDRNVDFKGRKKKLDLAARLKIAEETPDSIFVSIHMNSYTNPKYSGLQVWYSQNNPESYTLAHGIQSAVQSRLQPENKRTIKAATSSIFLLDNAKSPAVLVECGFLSNPEEATRFEDDSYKQLIAFTIFSSLMDFIEASG